MPELPEVETVRSCLAPKIAGRVIESVWVRKGSRLLRDAGSAAGFRRAVTGRAIEALGRRGKYLLLVLDSGGCLVVHLGMTGRIFTVAPGDPSPPHTHLRFHLNGSDLVLCDPRTFGRAFVVPAGELAAHPAFARMGPEPLDGSFTDEYICKFIAGRRTSIKALLLGQRLAAGVGNIYADEGCFGARVRPDRAADSLSAREITALRRSLQSVLRRSIACQGTTFRDYEWDQGKSGNFVGKLKVYGRQGARCGRCGGTVRREVTAGRSTFFCPECQK